MRGRDGLWILAFTGGCMGDGEGRLPLRVPTARSTVLAPADSAPRDGESGLPAIPTVSGGARCESNSKDVCGEFSPEAIAKCVVLGGGESTCSSGRWERGFYAYVVSQLEGNARALHCFADGKPRDKEVCGPFAEDLIKACEKASGGSACLGNRWDKSFHDSLLGGDSTAGMSWVFPTRRKDTPTCEGAGHGVGAFGAWRDGGARKHAGCDLYGQLGDQLYAISDGEVIAEPYDFYCDTDALEVRHGRKVVRYGEIKPGSSLRSGKVNAGDRIANIGRLSCYSQSMLHFEMYAGSETGPLSRGGGLYQRRPDLENPTALLKEWKGMLP